MAIYVLESYEDEGELKDDMLKAKIGEDILVGVNGICEKYQDGVFALFEKLWKEYKGFE